MKLKRFYLSNAKSLRAIYDEHYIFLFYFILLEITENRFMSYEDV